MEPTLIKPDRDEIEEVLKQFKACVIAGKYSIVRREKNDDFISEYRLSSDRQKEIFMNLKVEDFVRREYNDNPSYPPDVLVYIFSPKEKLRSFGVEKTVEIYIKFVFTGEDKTTRTVIISLHELESVVHRLFKQGGCENETVL